MLLIVRHAAPAIVAAAPPDQWELGESGRAVAAAMCATLPRGAVLVSSGEPKARQTIEAAGPVSTDARFNEVRRAGEPFDDGFFARRKAYVSGVDHDGWEPRTEVAARFAEGVDHWLARAAGRPLVIASHGMALTLWLTSAIGLPAPSEFWADLRLPDRLRVDLDGRAVSRWEPPDDLPVETPLMDPRISPTRRRSR